MYDIKKNHCFKYMRFMPVRRKEIKGNISRKFVLTLSEKIKGADMSYGDIRGKEVYIGILIS